MIQTTIPGSVDGLESGNSVVDDGINAALEQQHQHQEQ